MEKFPNNTSNFSEIFYRSLQYYFFSLTKIFLYIFVFVIVKNLPYYLYFLKKIPVISFLFDILVITILIYLFSTCLLRVNEFLHDQYISLLDTLKLIGKRSLKIFIAFTAIIIIALLLFFLSRWIIIDIVKATGLAAFIYFIIFLGTPLLFAFLCFFYVIPLIILENITILKAFYESAVLAKEEWMRIGGVYLIFVIVLYCIAPVTAHAYYLEKHHLLIVLDLVILLIAMPLICNMIIFLLHDLRLRNEESQM